MVIRQRSSIIARSWGRRLRPTVRAMERDVHSRLHDAHTEPGLTNLRASGFVDNDGVRIAWYECGAPAETAEVTVVFVHGYSLSSESFYSQANFVRENFPQARCLLVDLRGHGQSSEVPPARCTISAAADDVLRAIDARAPQGPLVIVGHSLGGMVALNVIRRARRDVATRMAGAVIISSSMRRFAARGFAKILHSRTMGWIYELCLRLPERMDRVRFEFASVCAPVFAALLQGFPQMDKLQFHVAMLLDTPLSSYTGFFDDLQRHSEFGAAARLRSIPGEVVVGDMDIVTPLSQSQLLVKHWPGAMLSTVESAGHMVILEEPEEVSQAIGRVLKRVLEGEG
ncbi:alpha/beta fold hydrolase [Corynebacterium sp.]|uniref:alpha/beta fold hydrolase n=1 Tax=Corynebacterium sp. TaxID=1720 RepID=UPI0026DB37DC|nr:alpha/beta hydrolase [Corynebacterium sp.]MDO5031310.1 alpha/beta hydrolase [Corynebacterium sp.]